MKIYVKLMRKGKGKGKVHPRTDHEGPEGEQRHSSTLSLTLTLDGLGGQRHVPAALPPGKGPGIYCTGGWVGPRAGLDGCGEISPPTGIRSPDLPARSESLYQLRYPGPKTFSKEQGNCACTGYRLFESKLVSRSQCFPEGPAAGKFRCFPSLPSVLD